MTGAETSTSPGMIETAFLLSPEIFEQIWSLSHEWTAEGPQTIILTIPTEDRVASILHSIPRLNAIRFGRQFNLSKIYEAGTSPIYVPSLLTTSHTVFFMSSLSQTLMHLIWEDGSGALNTIIRSFACFGTSSV